MKTNSHISRRAFMELLSLIPFYSLGMDRLMRSRAAERKSDGRPNVLILLFDAFSALDASIYGFQRNTTPNLEEFASRATLYHSHYAGGNYTTPGTASLLTGTYPWIHRALSLGSPMIDQMASRNIFNSLGQDGHHTIGFSQNLLATNLLFFLRDILDEFLHTDEANLLDHNLSDDIFSNDFLVASQAEWRSQGVLSDPNLVFLSSLFVRIRERLSAKVAKELGQQFPLGVPSSANGLDIHPLETTVDWLMDRVLEWPNPFLTYMHIMPPHYPYRTRRDFIGVFNDDWKSPRKPDCYFSDGYTHEALNFHRARYDEYIAYVDSEFGRLYRFLHAAGILDNTWLVVTSDHGEMFERGIWKHSTPTLYEPVVKIPLLVSYPGQDHQEDIYATTSCVDILPTLLHVTGQTVPDWCEGRILPPFNPEPPSSERSIYIVEAKSNPQMEPIRHGTVCLIKGPYKLIHYMGYDGFPSTFELFNLAEDPEELRDLYSISDPTAADLAHELLEKLDTVNAPLMP